METGSLVRTRFVTIFYKSSNMDDMESHFALGRDELLVFMGEKNQDDYVKCLARGVTGWIGKGAYEWL
jgi:hypothetical protein